MPIHIITTGGTFDKVYYDALSEFSIGEPQASRILEKAAVGFNYQLTSLLKKDSLEFTDQDRQLLKQTIEQSSASRFLVIHGTDTMTLSAQQLGQINGKTIVFTGAMQPALMRDTDAEFNLGFALGALQLLESGVYIAMNGHVFSAANAVKNRAASRFESVEDR